MWHDATMGWGWGGSVFGMGILFWVVLILVIAALVKYLFSNMRK